MTGEDKRVLSEFEWTLAHNIAHDAAGNLAVQGWTEGDDTDDDGRARRQWWVLRPVHETCPARLSPDFELRACRRCTELPDQFRPPLSPTAWRDQQWFELTGQRWDDNRSWCAPPPTLRHLLDPTNGRAR